MKRLSYLEKEFGIHLVEAFKAFDPTDKKYYLSWLIKNRSILGCLNMVRETLQLFHSVKNQLPKEKRDINNYDSLAQIDFASKNEVVKSKRQEERELKERVYKESIIHYKDSECMLVQPLTQEASTFWGRNTKWCTSSGGFDNYEELYIFIEGSEKYQLSSCGEFNDEEDEPLEGDYPMAMSRLFGIKELAHVMGFVDVSSVYNRNSFTQEELRGLLEKNPKFFRFIEKPTEVESRSALERDISNISYVSSLYIDGDSLSQALEKDREAFIDLEISSESIRSTVFELAPERVLLGEYCKDVFYVNCALLGLVGYFLGVNTEPWPDHLVDPSQLRRFILDRAFALGFLDEDKRFTKEEWITIYERLEDNANFYDNHYFGSLHKVHISEYIEDMDSVEGEPDIEDYETCALSVDLEEGFYAIAL